MGGTRVLSLLLLLAGTVGAQNATNVTATSTCVHDFCSVVGSNGMEIKTPLNESVFPVRTDTTSDFITFFVVTPNHNSVFLDTVGPYVEDSDSDRCSVEDPKPAALFDVFEEFPSTACGVDDSLSATEFQQKTGLKLVMVKLSLNTQNTRAITTQIVCFTAGVSQRCIFLRPIRRPSSVKIEAYNVDGTVITLPITQGDPEDRALTATVGGASDGEMVNRFLRFEVKVDMDNQLDSVEIMNEISTSELPRQHWMSATKFNASLTPPFSREIEYRPTRQAAGQTFKLTFQGLTKLGAQSTFTMDGSAWCRCQSDYEGAGRCSPSLCSAHELTYDSDEYTVFVRQVRVAFNFDVPGNQILYVPGSNDQPTGSMSQAGPGTLAQAHVNCPMVPIGISASNSFILNKEIAIESPLTLEIVDDHPPMGFKSLREMGLRMSDTSYFYIIQQFQIDRDTSDSANAIQDVRSKEYYASVTFTPTVETMGQRRSLCVRARGQGVDEVGCVDLEVVRCSYCTLPGETLHSVADVFHTNWLQLWSANSQNESAVDPSRVDGPLKNPRDLGVGTRLVLGPVYKLDIAQHLSSLAHEYQTTEEAILTTNKNLSPLDTVVHPGEICILPGICSTDESFGTWNV